MGVFSRSSVTFLLEKLLQNVTQNEYEKASELQSQKLFYKSSAVWFFFCPERFHCFLGTWTMLSNLSFLHSSVLWVPIFSLLKWALKCKWSILIDITEKVSEVTGIKSTQFQSLLLVCAPLLHGFFFLLLYSFQIPPTLFPNQTLSFLANIIPVARKIQCSSASQRRLKPKRGG